ncbi:uncharacterized protein LOC131006252 [Salvia miltiorrhiza]|uniref:uncharacterized protein LOC131006252 n=1 Tax=Salvia miltiorrhiza TaxID=226208 RepID=UPI0025AC1818|nr:uncharacterized protein LOC131006252 [Salvia miltiorrhiza]
MANRVRQMIHEEVGDKYFCILVDEAQDISKKEKMAIILRFVNDQRILTEHFFAIKSVSDTTSLNLKKEICRVISHHDLQVEKMRGHGYDGASNMRGSWNGLQTLFLRDCPYAYYIHCFAHRLQLAIVSAAKDISVIWEFISHLDNVVNIITSSPKRILQRKVQDILAAIAFVSTTKTILQELRESGCWEEFLEEVKVFCLKNDIDVPNLDSLYKILKTLSNQFNSDNICKLARKFYPEDFTDQDIVSLEYELEHYKHDVIVMQEFQVSTLVELSQLLMKSARSKHVKTALRNNMGDDLLED